MGLPMGQKNISDETAHSIDEEVRRIVEENYAEATRVLKAHDDKLHAMADALMKYETIDRDQIDDIMNGRPPRPPKESDGPTGAAPGGGAADAGDETPAEEGVGAARPASEH
jgi:cell division protease FtsH